MWVICRTQKIHNEPQPNSTQHKLLIKNEKKLNSIFNQDALEPYPTIEDDAPRLSSIYHVTVQQRRSVVGITCLL